MKISKLMRAFSRNRSERGASMVEYLLLVGLIGLGSTAVVRLYERTVEEKTLRATCMLQPDGGGTVGTIGNDERTENFTEPILPSDDGIPEDQQAAEILIQDCIRMRRLSLRR